MRLEMSEPARTRGGGRARLRDSRVWSVLVAVPRVGPTPAVLLETLLILAVSWWLARQCAARFEVGREVSAWLVMRSLPSRC